MDRISPPPPMERGHYGPYAYMMPCPECRVRAFHIVRLVPPLPMTRQTDRGLFHCRACQHREVIG